MCFYEQYRHPCGDFKWGNFKQHCAKEYRTGETCGMKLVYDTIHCHDNCKLCTKIQIKLGRIYKEEEKVRRWKREGNKRNASIAKSEEEIRGLQQEIANLEWERKEKQADIGGRPSY